MGNLVAKWDGHGPGGWIGIVRVDSDALYVWDAGRIVELSDYLRAHCIDSTKVDVIPVECLSKVQQRAGVRMSQDANFYAEELRAALTAAADTLDAQIAELGNDPDDATPEIARNVWGCADRARDAAREITRAISAADARGRDLTRGDIAHAEQAFAHAAVMARIMNGIRA